MKKRQYLSIDVISADIELYEDEILYSENESEIKPILKRLYKQFFEEYQKFI